MEITSILGNISLLMAWYLPGYAYFAALNHFRTKTFDRSTAETINCVMISVLASVAVWSLVPSIDQWKILLITVPALFVTGILVALLTNSGLYNRMFAVVFHRTRNASFWDDVINPGGTMAVIERNDLLYSGAVRYMQNNNEERFIQLFHFEIQKKNGEIVETGVDGETLILRINDTDIIHFSCIKKLLS